MTVVVMASKAHTGEYVWAWTMVKSAGKTKTTCIKLSTHNVCWFTACAQYMIAKCPLFAKSIKD